MYRITNVSVDPSPVFQEKRRCAPKMQMEPIIGGMPLKIRSKRDISDAVYEANKDEILRHVKHGVMTCECLNDPSSETVGELPYELKKAHAETAAKLEEDLEILPATTTSGAPDSASEDEFEDYIEDEPAVEGETPETAAAKAKAKAEKPSAQKAQKPKRR